MYCPRTWLISNKSMKKIIDYITLYLILRLEPQILFLDIVDLAAEVLQCVLQL